MAATFGRRLRKGATGTAIAAAAMAALTASQASDLLPQAPENTGRSTPDAALDEEDSPITGGSPYYTDLPPLTTAPGTGSGPAPGASGQSGIPATVLDAYKKAAIQLAGSKPRCNLRWELLAAIGKVESGHARGGAVTADGTTRSPILGPVLNGTGFANIPDTDDGAYDGNRSHDRAVGPMQFIPSTWETWGRDANGDGERDPNNIYDAALAAGSYLCAGDRDLAAQADLDRAILGYNPSREYLRTVLTWFDFYKKGSHEVPDGTGSLPRDRSDDGPTPDRSPKAPGNSNDNGGPGSPTPPSSPPPSNGPGKPNTPTTPPTPTPTPTPPTVSKIEASSAQELTAWSRADFATRPQVRAQTAKGAAISGVRVQFTILGTTDTTFSGRLRNVTVETGARGYATAPVLRAGERTGDFTVRAKVLDRPLPDVSFAGTVVASHGLSVSGEPDLTAQVGGEFAGNLSLEATYRGAPSAGVAATATMIKSIEDPVPNDNGPFFKQEDETVRSLSGLQTNGDGLLELPTIHAGDTAGTFTLRVTTTGGAVLDVKLTVEAAAAQ